MSDVVLYSIIGTLIGFSVGGVTGWFLGYKSGDRRWR